MNLDFSKMKKVASDGKTATFQHPRGHIVKIALDALSEKHRNAVKELTMAGGGEVTEEKPKPPPPQPNDTGTKISQGFNGALGFAGGGEAQPEDFQPGKDYSEAAKTGSTAPPVVVNVQAPQPAQDKPEEKGRPGIWDAVNNSLALTHPHDPNGPTIQQATGFQGFDKQGTDQPQAAGTPGTPGTPTPTTPATPPPDQAAQQPQPEPQPAPAQPQPQAQQQPPAPTGPEQVFQNSKMHMADENQKLEAALNNGTITPKTYQDLFNNKDSTLGKIGTIFGLLISGAGSGLAHQPNALMAMMDKQIDNDLNAQQKSQDNKMNLMGMARKQLMDNASIAHLNMETAKGQQDFKIMQKAQADMNATQIAFHKMVTEMAKMPDNDPKKAAAQATLANLYPAVKDKLSKLEDINAGIMAQHSQMNGPDVDPATLVAANVPQHLQKEVYEEIKNAQDVKGLTPKIMKAFDLGSSRNPVTAAQGQREFEALINTTVKEKEDTARAAAFDSIHRTMTPSGLFASPGENSARRRTVEEYLSSKRSAPIAKNFHIDLSKFNTTNMEPEEATKAEVKKMNGVQYQKVQGGWKKVQ